MSLKHGTGFTISISLGSYFSISSQKGLEILDKKIYFINWLSIEYYQKRLKPKKVCKYQSFFLQKSYLGKKKTF
jgi:hypothetical protein